MISIKVKYIIQQLEQKLKERIDSITHEKFLNFALNFFKDSKRLEIHIVNQKHLDWEL